MVTVEQVKEAIKKKYGDGFIPLRECSICKESIGYYPQEDESLLWFDSGCGCGGGGGRYCGYEDIADTINMQSNPKGYEYLKNHFGIEN